MRRILWVLVILLTALVAPSTGQQTNAANAGKSDLDKALELIAAGKHTEAIPMLERLMVQQPTEEVYYYLGGAHVHEKAWDKAAATYEDGATRFPLSARLNYAAGLANERRFEPGKALQFYRRAVRLDPMLAYQGGGRYDAEIDALYIPVVHDHRGVNSCSGRLYYDDKGMHYIVYLVYSGWGQGNDDSFQVNYDLIDNVEVDHKKGQQSIDYSVLTLLTNLSGPRRRIAAGEEARVDLKFFFKKPIEGYRGGPWTKNDLKFFFIEPEMGDLFVKYLASRGVRTTQRVGD
ncbi:MAG: tetratricopeptide repeat protein [Terriglobales bacterium]